MKLHLPVILRKALLACFAFTFACTKTVFAADLTLGSTDSLTIDYAGADSIPDLDGGALTLKGDTLLLLSNCSSGDGKTYTLLTGVGDLQDAEGNPLSLTDENNAALLYFDTTQPGTGFWGGGWLQLTSEGHVQLVLHGGEVQEALTISTRQTGSKTYNYYEGICFRDITYTLSGTSSAFGGTIYGESYSTVTLSNNGSVVFSGNSASFFSTSSTSAFGGAIYGDSYSTVTLSNNGSVTFTGNEASSSSYRGAYGGAIYGGSNSTITLSNNGSVVFAGNTASSCGQISGDTVTLSNNGIEVLELLYDIARGGAIYGDYGSTIALSNNGSVVFEGNTASSFDYASGGAIDGSTIDLNNNASVSFIENTAGVGGAICGGTIELSGNGSVEFSGNSASLDSGIARGGAIYGDYGSTIALSNNGSVVFEGNTASSLGYTYGGAIHGDTITLSNNGSVTFSGNNASSDYARGGAIYAEGALHIRNNDSVEFAGNVEKSDSAYRLRSVYASVGGSELSISAAAGKSVAFYDSIYVGENATVNLNADYEDAEGNIIEQKGDIVFTGATTVADLYKAKGNVDGTEEEIRLSRTSEVLSMANLYNGRLIIKEGAIWSGSGITVGPVAGATGKPTLLLQNGILTHVASSATNHNVVTIKSGGAFEVAGKSQADYTSLNMESGSILTFNIAPENASTAALTLDSNSSLTQEGALTLKLKGDYRLVKGLSYKLLTGLDQPDTWDETSVTVESGSLGWDVDYTDLTWEGDTLWIYYNGNILPPVEFRPNLDRNQQEVYDTIKDVMGEGNPGGVLGALGREILDSRDETALKRALDELSGREYATIMSSQMEGSLGHLRRLRAAAGAGTPLGEYVTFGCCYPSNKGVDKSDNKGSSVMIAPSPVIDSRRIRAGVSAFHEQAELDADANGDGFDRSETGAQLTMEYLVSNDFVLGMGLSHSRTKLSPTYGKRRHEDNTHFDLFGVYRSGRWSSTTALGVGLHQHELGRTVAGMQTEAEADGLSVNFLQDVAYTVWADEQHGVQVFGSVESSFNMIDEFSESGAGNASLLVDEQEAWATDVTLGMRYNRALPALGKALPGTLTVQAGVVASLGDREHDVSMRFAGAEAHGYKQHAAERNRWGYNVGISVNLPVTAETALYGSAEAVIRNASTSVDAQLGVKMAF